MEVYYIQWVSSMLAGARSYLEQWLALTTLCGSCSMSKSGWFLHSVKKLWDVSGVNLPVHKQKLIDWLNEQSLKVSTSSKAVLCRGKPHGSQALPSVSEWSTTMWPRVRTPRSPSTFTLRPPGAEILGLKASRLHQQAWSASNELKIGKKPI